MEQNSQMQNRVVKQSDGVYIFGCDGHAIRLRRLFDLVFELNGYVKEQLTGSVLVSLQQLRSMFRESRYNLPSVAVEQVIAVIGDTPCSNKALRFRFAKKRELSILVIDPVFQQAVQDACNTDSVIPFSLKNMEHQMIDISLISPEGKIAALEPLSVMREFFTLNIGGTWGNRIDNSFIVERTSKRILTVTFISRLGYVYPRGVDIHEFERVLDAFCDGDFKH